MPPPPISHSPHTWPSPPKVSRPYIWVQASSALFKHMQNVQLSCLCEWGGASLLWGSGSDRRIYAVCPCETLENSRKTKSTTFSVNAIARRGGRWGHLLKHFLDSGWEQSSSSQDWHKKHGTHQIWPYASRGYICTCMRRGNINDGCRVM